MKRISPEESERRRRVIIMELYGMEGRFTVSDLSWAVRMTGWDDGGNGLNTHCGLVVREFVSAGKVEQVATKPKRLYEVVPDD